MQNNTRTGISVLPDMETLPGIAGAKFRVSILSVSTVIESLVQRN